ncbi:MAG: lysylphosphatidylglycerol synthase transmembrane domain-containing protein [Chloroflexota bacterium]
MKDEHIKQRPTGRKAFPWGTLLKVGVTVVGLAIVIGSIDLRELGQTLRQASWIWILVGFILTMASYWLRSVRWLILLRGLGAQLSLGRLLELYLIGGFFNALLPSGFGGDVVRAVEAAQDTPPEVAVGTVFVVRLSRLMGLFFMALVALIWRPASFPDTLALQIGVICLLGLIIGLFLLEGSLLLRLSYWLPGPLKRLGHGLIQKILAAVQECGWRSVAGALAVSLLFNLLLIGWWTAGARALDLPVTFGHHFLIVPIWSIALLVPSIGGLGVREMMAPTLYGALGLSATEAVALTLLVFGIERFSSLVGAPVYILSTLRPGREAVESRK